MNTITRAMTEMSPRTKARLAGAFYLLTILTGVFAQGFVSARLVVSGDAAATANNILSHDGLFRLGFAVYMIEMVCQIITTVLIYDLLKPVNRSVSLLAAVLSLIGCGIKTFSRLFYFAPLLVLGGTHYLSVFSGEQLNAVALLFLRVNDIGAGIALVFFGFYALLKGYLVIRSTFLPRALGWLAVLGGIGWLAYLSPPFGDRVFSIIALLGIVGALANIGWLLVFGVNEERWREQASVAEASIWR
ncbi:MAG TPA: DUF4386 domain-containing protein [Gemmatimonadaceae bacterium]